MEKLYWMVLNDHGVDEIGYLMTEEQLLKELPNIPGQFIFGGTTPARRPESKDIERMIKEDMEAYHQDVRGFEGEYSPNCTFFVQEVTDAAELIELITWKDYDPCEGYTAVEMNEEYPDYVPKELRLPSCVYGDEPGWTSENLPRSGEPTNGHNNVVCDIKFKYSTTEVARECVIAKAQKCSYEYKGDHLEWGEPGDFQVFRNTFDTVLKGIYDEWLQRLKNLCEMKEIVGSGSRNISWAKGVMFLPAEDDITQADIKEMRNRLVKVFHPDNAKTGDAKIALMVNEAYQMLSKEL